MMEVDHETRKVYVEHIKLLGDENIQLMEPSGEGVLARLTSPIVTTYIDTEKISFERLTQLLTMQAYCKIKNSRVLIKISIIIPYRNKAGLWGWRSDKSEVVNGHECKVFSASNVELITKTRLEHLSEADKIRARSPRTPLQSFLGITEQTQQETASMISVSKIYYF